MELKSATPVNRHCGWENLIQRGVNNSGKVYHQNNLEVNNAIVVLDNSWVVYVIVNQQYTRKNPLSWFLVKLVHYYLVYSIVIIYSIIAMKWTDMRGSSFLQFTEEQLYIL